MDRAIARSIHQRRILKKNTIRTLEVIFHIRLRAPWLSSSLILKCFCMLVFLSVIENIVVP